MKIILSGYGKMGQMINGILAQRSGVEVFHTEDVQSFDKDIAAEAVCIDFTTPNAFKENYKFLADNFKAVVVGTTGWNDISEEVFSYFREKGITLIYGTNFSIGVMVMFQLTALCSKLLSKYGYESDLTEIHHIYKLDKPSGTASTISTIMRENGCAPLEIESIREGEAPGTHITNYQNEVDKISITHEAFSRKGFALGAVEAAFMTESKEGVFEFRELFNN